MRYQLPSTDLPHLKCSQLASTLFPQYECYSLASTHSGKSAQIPFLFQLQIVGCLPGIQVKELDRDRLPLPTIESRKSYVDQWKHRRRIIAAPVGPTNLSVLCYICSYTPHSSLLSGCHTPTGDSSAEGFSLLLL